MMRKLRNQSKRSSLEWAFIIRSSFLAAIATLYNYFSNPQGEGRFFHIYFVINEGMFTFCMFIIASAILIRLNCT